jgi:hypothetical protein
MTHLSKPGYTRQVYLRLTKNVYSYLKRKGLNPTWNETQKFVSLYLFEKYKKTQLSKINYSEVFKIVDYETINNKKQISELIEIDPYLEDDCESVFLVPINDYLLIEWFDINTAIQIIPEKVKIRVNAGPFGITNIDFRKNINYYNDGISNIVANIRKEVNNKSGVDYFFEGETKLIPGKKDNGNNCNYFIDFVLEIDGIKVPSSGLVVDENITLKEITSDEFNSRKINKKEIENKRRKEIQENKKAREIKKQEEQKLVAAKKRKRGIDKPSEDKENEEKQDYAKILELLYRDWKEGTLSTAEYKKLRSKILKKL